MTRTKPQLPVISKIANKIEKAINTILDDESELQMERRNTSKHISIKVSNPQAYVLSLSEVEMVIKAISEIVRENEDKVSIIFDTDPVICNIGVIYQAVINITIHK